MLVPGLPGGRVVEEPIELVDVMPTVMELLGLSPPSGLHATSLAGVLRGGQRLRGDEEVFSECLSHGPERKALISGDWKVILTATPVPGGGADRFAQGDAGAWYWRLEPVRLYNLKADPEEAVSVSDREPEVAQRLTARLMAICERNQAAYTENRAGFVVRDPDSMGGEALRELKALGYIE
jgi:arylsulfatase A-like enzyme